MRTQIEMIISYTTDGTDYQYSDNHGVLIRCENCRHFNARMERCNEISGEWFERDYCSKGERKDETD